MMSKVYDTEMEISGVKEKGLKRIRGLQMSLRAFVTILVILLSGTILIVYSYLSSKLHYERYMESLMQNISTECKVLSGNLIENDFEIDSSIDLNLMIDNIANHFYGRVMIVDDDYRIIKDTFGSDTRGYIINRTVIEVMTGERASSVEEYDGFIQCMYPVVDGEDIRGVMIVNASTKYINQISRNVKNKNILVSVLIMLFSVVFAYLIGKFSVRGIIRINRQMEATKDGHLDEKLPEQGFKEFRTLTKNYNDTIGRLMVLDSTRQEFVSNVSHELKTPITSMKVLADSLIQNADADLDMYKEFMTDIVEEIDRESKIITDLLTLVKMDKKSAEMNIEEVDINALLEVILKRVSPIAASRNIEITYENYREVIAEVDEVKLSLALTNIIENAVKYNVDNGWVKVTLNADHKNVHIKVADSGVGIPEDCKDQVFERFYRVDKARSRDTGGTGLGLAITKNVILMHRGTIKLYSEYGEGTTFTIKIPIKYVEETK